MHLQVRLNIKHDTRRSSPSFVFRLCPNARLFAFSLQDTPRSVSARRFHENLGGSMIMTLGETVTGGAFYLQLSGHFQ